uniref:RAP domain-containing protein n=1 Tax=Eutreptiella gymnastica TaxID=73025 RepID=A0A7S4FVH6_9EUGL
MGEYHPDLMATFASRILKDGAVAEFPAQNVALTVWAFATLGVYDADMMAAFASHIRKPGVLDEFNPQNLANTAWAFATLGAQDSDLMAAVAARFDQNLQSRWNVTSFAGQEAANLAWGLVVSNALLDKPIAQLLALAVALDGSRPLAVQQIGQLHQVLLHVRLHARELPLSNKLLPHIRPLVERCAQSFAENSRRVSPSQLQRSVAAGLQRLGVAFREEVVLEDAGGYSVDMLLPEARVAIEVDGPSHFVKGADGLLPSGPTLLKRRQLEAFGYRVVSVPFWEWGALRSEGDEAAYLQQRGFGA